MNLFKKKTPADEAKKLRQDVDNLLKAEDIEEDKKRRMIDGYLNRLVQIILNSPPTEVLDDIEQIRIVINKIIARMEARTMKRVNEINRIFADFEAKEKKRI
tara:strand:+ start:158 stop:463 length:306 start_codon:yes stop_codon:yes gene_type:complete